MPRGWDETNVEMFSSDARPISVSAPLWVPSPREAVRMWAEGPVTLFVLEID